MVEFSLIEMRAALIAIVAEIDRVERSESPWTIFEEDLKSAAAKLRAKLGEGAAGGVPVSEEIRMRVACEWLGHGIP
jgi:hypothetical protein